MFFLIFLILFSPVTRASEPLNRLRVEIEKNFSLNPMISDQALSNLVLRSIEQANPQKIGFTSGEIPMLAQEVVRTSQCYGVDPLIMTSLIWRESNFKPRALSYRGAVGLTQMTQSGVQEVLERLNPVSGRRLGFLRRAVSRCNPKVLDRVPTLLSADTLTAWKNAVSVSPTDALVMGILLLKIKLASTKPEKSILGLMHTYRSALERYNGDAKIKVQFADDVLQLSKRMAAVPEVALNDSKLLQPSKAF